MLYLHFIVDLYLFNFHLYIPANILYYYNKITFNVVFALIHTSSDVLAHELWQAVLQQDNDEVRHLLECGGDPNHPLYWSQEWAEQNQKPPLHTACFLGDIKIIKSLVEYGANPKKGDPDNKTALHHASMWGHKKVIQYLVKDVHCKIGEHDYTYSVSVYCLILTLILTVNKNGND